MPSKKAHKIQKAKLTNPGRKRKRRKAGIKYQLITLKDLNFAEKIENLGKKAKEIR